MVHAVMIVVQVLALGLPIILAIVYFVAIVYFRWLDRKAVVRDRNEIEALGVPPLTCPGCGGEARPGYVLASQGVVWRDLGSKPFRTNTTIFHALDNTMSYSLSRRENLAWRCESCKIIIIDHSAQVGAKGGKKSARSQ